MMYIPYTDTVYIILKPNMFFTQNKLQTSSFNKSNVKLTYKLEPTNEKLVKYFCNIQHFLSQMRIALYIQYQAKIDCT